MGNEITQYDQPINQVERWDPDQVVQQVGLIQKMMDKVMKKDEHYGTIPGCGDKPTLLKSGAEKLGLTFRLASQLDINKSDLPGGHREYEVICTLTHIPTGQIWGQGVGLCSSMESKYRFRTGPVEPTGKPVPKEYWDIRKSNPLKAQDLLGGVGFQTRKVNGTWQIVRQGEKVENDNIADTFNTVLKMAKKRALVDAMLTATAASDIFTQDIEDFKETETVQEEKTEEKKSGSTTSGNGKLTKDQQQIKARISTWLDAESDMDEKKRTALIKTLTKNTYVSLDIIKPDHLDRLWELCEKNVLEYEGNVDDLPEEGGSDGK